MTHGSTVAARGERMTKVKRSSETEAMILDAARGLLAEGGLPALSMRVVAERAGLTATAIYHYFDGKDDLVSRVVRGGYQRFGKYLHEVMEQHPAGSLERIFALGDAYVRFAFENQEHFRVLYSIQARIPCEVDELPGGGGYGLLRDCVVDAIEAGTLRDADPDLVAHYLWTSVHGLVTLAMACKLETPDCLARQNVPGSAVEMFRAFAPFLVGGLARSNGTAAPDGDQVVWWKQSDEG